MVVSRIMKVVFLLLFCSTSLYSWKMEADKIVVKNTTGGFVTHINFRQSYDMIPLVFTLATDAGSDAASIRVNNITTTGFDVYIAEADGTNGTHVEMSSVPYIAIEEGNHEFPDGTKIVAQKVSTNTFQSRSMTGKSWDNITLSGFTTIPVVLGQIQSRNSERTDVSVPGNSSQPWLTTVIKSVSSSGFQLALERSETLIGTIQNEEIAYLAMESAMSGGNHYFASSEADKIEYETIKSTNIIKGWQNSTTGYVVNFSKAYTNPIAVVTKNTRNGNNGGWLRRRSITSSSIALVVDEDTSTDNERSHIAEVAGIVLFSEPFDVDFTYVGQAGLVINELLYNETVTGTSNDEFVELYVNKSGNLKGFVLSDQDTNSYTFPSFTVTLGDYVVLHSGLGSDNTVGNVHHFYKNSSTILNNDEDDVLLLQPSNDVIILTDNEVFNAIPIDYIAYGRNSAGGNIDITPMSMKSVGLTWDYNYGIELKNAGDGQSIALTPNASDSNKAGCWELTASGNASDNGCSGYILTVDSDVSSIFTYSMGISNTDTLSKPDIKLSKNSLTVYDPVNLEVNPKAIPGALLVYSISASNEGLGATDEDSIAITDNIPTNMKLCVSTVSRCSEIGFTNGAVSSTLSLGNLEYSNNNGTDFLYVPTADVEGFDSDVTNVRVKLNGSFKQSDGTNHPSFTLELKMGII